MTKYRFKVSVTPTTISVNPADYQDEWDEHCAERVEDEEDEGRDNGLPPVDFVLKKVQEEFNEGDRDLNEAFDGEEITVEVR